MTGSIINAIVGGIIGLGGAYLGYRWARSISLENIRITEFNKASSDFRAAFAPTLAFLYIARQHGTHDKPDTAAHIKAALLSHGAAIEIFRPFVPECDRSDYQKAWEKYRDNVAKDQYAIAVEPRVENITIEEFFGKRIHEILHYAQIK